MMCSNSLSLPASSRSTVKEHEIPRFLTRAGKSNSHQGLGHAACDPIHHAQWPGSLPVLLNVVLAIYSCLVCTEREYSIDSLTCNVTIREAELLLIIDFYQCRHPSLQRVD